MHRASEDPTRGRSHGTGDGEPDTLSQRWSEAGGVSGKVAEAGHESPSCLWLGAPWESHHPRGS